jgi:hypothetical protein
MPRTAVDNPGDNVGKIRRALVYNRIAPVDKLVDNSAAGR